MTHELKVWPVYFDALWDGRKTFEMRRNDRNFQLGDYLRLRDYDPESGEYSGDEILAEITYRLLGGQFGVAEDHCVLSLTVLERKAAQQIDHCHENWQERQLPNQP